MIATIETLFQARNQKLAAAAVELLEADNPMTLRQLFYRLVSAKCFPSTDKKHYKRLSGSIMNKLRENHIVPFEWIIDRVRCEIKPLSWSSVEDFADDVRHWYRRDFWETQGDCVEVLIEKNALAGVVERITKRYDVSLLPLCGYPSISVKAELADKWARIDKPLFVYYAGDYDASGFNIEDEAARWIYDNGGGYQFRTYEYGNNELAGDRGWLRFSWVRENGHRIEWRRVGILKSDFDNFGLLELQVKDTDSRSESFRQRYGDACAEIEAIPASEVNDRVERAIQSHIDLDLWAEMEDVEAREMTHFRAAIDKLSEFGLDQESSDEGDDE